MSLVPDYEDSENSTTDSESDSEKPTESAAPTTDPKPALPTPSFLTNAHQADPPRGSVFANPYAQAENEKQAILERHVKMVSAKEDVRTINGKKICWNYRKGRCRFGHNCVYAHDSDLQKDGEEVVPGQVVLNKKVEKQKRKRPGLTQGLVPGKKVMKEYTRLKK